MEKIWTVRDRALYRNDKKRLIPALDIEYDDLVLDKILAETCEYLNLAESRKKHEQDLEVILSNREVVFYNKSGRKIYLQARSKREVWA